jgi:hypothetical protein
MFISIFFDLIKKVLEIGHIELSFSFVSFNENILRKADPTDSACSPEGF